MKIALIGYGKMGKTIERLAESNHEIVLRIDRHNLSELNSEAFKSCDVAIEFSRPDAAFDNIKASLEAGVPTVSGTTGWLEKKELLEKLCAEKGGAFFYASNFSLGVNLFFDLNEKFAKIINNFPQYKIGIKEVHHIHKLDSPSGTAISLAEKIISGHQNYMGWHLDSSEDENKLPIFCEREGEVPGTHSVEYTSEMDRITIQHEAFTRESFAQGALFAAEWLQGKKGIFSMKDLMQSE